MGDEPIIEELDPLDRSTQSAPSDLLPRHAASASLGGMPAAVVQLSVIVPVLIALAVVKPWAWFGNLDREAAVPASPGPVSVPVIAQAAGPAGPVPADPTPVSPEPTLPPGAVSCGLPHEWRFVTAGGLGGGPGDALTEIQPVDDAMGPADPRIPSIPAGEAPLQAVGACRPQPARDGGDDRTVRPPVRIIAAWSLGSGTLGRMPLAPTGPPAASSAAVQLYVPAGSGARGWAPGHYVIELGSDDLAVADWLAFDVTDPPHPVSPAP